MPVLQGSLRSHHGVERRAIVRTTINRDVLMFYMGQDRLHACCVCNITNQGAGIRLNGLIVLPSEFAISFDRFRTARRCRLIWREGDFIGTTFES